MARLADRLIVDRYDVIKALPPKRNLKVSSKQPLQHINSPSPLSLYTSDLFLLRHSESPTAKIASIFRRLFGFSSQLSPATMSEAKSKADKLIHDNAVMIFSKTYCPHCAHSKEVLQAKQKEYEAKGTPFTLDIFELNEACECLDPRLQVKPKP